MLFSRDFEMSLGQNEAFSRIPIDKALEFSGWICSRQVQFELHTSNGRADRLLWQSAQGRHYFAPL
jgi:hypothetical protein